MKFSDFVSSKSIRASLSSADKESVVNELVDSLLEAGALRKRVHVRCVTRVY